MPGIRRRLPHDPIHFQLELPAEETDLPWDGIALQTPPLRSRTTLANRGSFPTFPPGRAARSCETLPRPLNQLQSPPRQLAGPPGAGRAEPFRYHRTLRAGRRTEEDPTDRERP